MEKVILGLSGGVDSSVAAALLKKQGYEVIGITFKFVDNFDPKDAIKVAETLDIEHHIIDYREVFKEKVIDKFLSDYKSGITPNPCVICNKNVKLRFLLDEMYKFNADYIATGHYAKIKDNRLFKSVDLNKDQTYFLCEVTKEQLNKVLFPLEGISKDIVRNIALEYNLINANKKDSTDVCFITSKFKDYIVDKINNNKGSVIDVETNKVIGEHNGLNRYTIGQRKGLGIGGTKDRMFVVGKNVKDNILYIALGDTNNYLISDSCIVTSVNWLGDKKIDECTSKFRYRQQETNVDLELLNDTEVLVKYPQGVKSVTPGQACVFYNGDECLGGGIIKEVRKDNKKLWYL